MTQAISRINAYRTAVIATVQTAMPELKNADVLFGRFNIDDLKQNSFKTPSVQFGVLSCRIERQANNIDAKLGCAAFAVTDGKDRDAAAWTIAEAIAVLLKPSQLFGINNMSAPEAMKITPMVSGDLRTRGVAVIAVEWTQTLRNVGPDVFDDEGHLITELYINDEAVPADDEGENV